MGGFGDMLFGTKGSYTRDPYGTLNPEQKNLMQTMAPTITSKATQGPITYSGEFNSPYTDIERDNMLRQSRLSSMGEDWASKFQPGYIDPEVDANERRNLEQAFYGNGIYPGAKALAEEQYAGAGGYWGTPRANAVLNEYNASVVSPYQNWRSQALQNSYGNALNYTGAMNNLRTNTQQLAEVPRLIRDANLSAKYNDWINAQNMDRQNIDAALRFLDIDTVTERYNAGKTGMIGTLGAVAGGMIGNSIAPGVGGAIGAQLGGSLAGGFDRSGTGGNGGADAIGSAFMLDNMIRSNTVGGAKPGGVNVSTTGGEGGYNDTFSWGSPSTMPNYDPYTRIDGSTSNLISRLTPFQAYQIAGMRGPTYAGYADDSSINPTNTSTRYSSLTNMPINMYSGYWQ